MKILILTILVCLFPCFLFAQEPDATTQASPLYTKEKPGPKSSDESETTTLEEIQKSLEEIKQDFKNIEETQELLKSDRQKLKQAIINSNEIATVKVLQSVAQDCESFRQEQRLKSYPKKFEELSDYVPEKIINAIDASSAAYGYYYQYSYINKDSYTLKASPAIEGTTGERIFILDETGRVINEATGKSVTLEE